MESALKDVRILDLSRALAGPFGSMLLADLGAEVIRVEAPRSRRDVSGPLTYKGMNPYELCVNRNSRKFTTPPLLHQHMEEVPIGLLHYSQGQIETLRREEVIG
jgi:crotonobetainyl-CoA:carnitine CoA-transferase CaiB-like acyl-CoA transferase